MLSPEVNSLSIRTKYDIMTIAVSPNGKHIASAGYGKECLIQIWDLKSGKQIGQSMKGHLYPIYEIKYSQCGTLILSCSEDKTIRQWSTITYQEISQPITGHNGAVQGVAYSHNQRYIVSSSKDNTIRIWNAKTGKEQVSKRIQTYMSPCSAISTKKTELVFGNVLGQICVWDYHRHKQCRWIFAHTHVTYCISYSIDNSLLISGGHDLTIRIFHIQSGQQVGNTLFGHESNIFSVNFSPDMRYIISGADDETVRIWDWRIGEQIGESLCHHSREIYSTQFTLDGKYIITGGVDREIYIIRFTIN